MEFLEALEFLGEVGVGLGGVLEGLEGGLGCFQVGLLVGGELVVLDVVVEVL